MKLWGNYPDEKDEYGNTLLKGEVVEALDVLERLLVKHEALVSERAVKRNARMTEAGITTGRTAMVLPSREELLKRIKRTPLASLAKEVGCSRASIRNRIQGGYYRKGKFVEMKGV